MTKETYYAIRIGKPGKHSLYFKIRDDELTPQLFNNKQAAKNEISNEKYEKVRASHWKVVKVELRELP